MKKKNISKRGRGSGKTDFDRLAAMKDDDIDLGDIPPLSPEFFANGIMRTGLRPVQRKKQITLRLDEDVLKFFKKLGKGYQTRINQVLKAYAEAHHKPAR